MLAGQVCPNLPASSSCLSPPASVSKQLRNSLTCLYRWGLTLWATRCLEGCSAGWSIQCWNTTKPLMKMGRAIVKTILHNGEKTGSARTRCLCRTPTLCRSLGCRTTVPVPPTFPSFDITWNPVTHACKPPYGSALEQKGSRANCMVSLAHCSWGKCERTTLFVFFQAASRVMLMQQTNTTHCCWNAAESDPPSNTTCSS